MLFSFVVVMSFCFDDEYHNLFSINVVDNSVVCRQMA